MDKAHLAAFKASRPILQVAEALGLEVRNGRIRCLRPENHAHGDRTPSVSLSADRGSFRCWVCPDVRGDVIDLVKLAKGCSFREALEFLGAPAGTPRRSLRPAAVPPAPAAPSPSVASGPPASLVIEPDGQTALLPQVSPAPAGAPAARPPPASPAPASGDRFPPPAAAAAGDPPSPAHAAPDGTSLRLAVLAALLRLAVPIGGPVARYLQKRRIFKRTWDGQHLRMIEDYGGVSTALEREFGRAALERSGFFNAAGHLRYYRHRLLFPYLDPSGKPVYLQARGIDADVTPKELSMAGPIPLPYNARLLDGRPGQIYLCEGVIDTLTLIEQGFPAVGVPGAANFKPAWTALFRGKTVHVAFDPDAPGESGAAKAIAVLESGGVDARRLQPPKGLDLNDWFRKG